MAVEHVPDVGRSALRKAGWRLLPLIALGYGISYIDRSNISFAALQMNQDLRFSAAVYGLGAGLFFLSYALFEVPSNLLLVRFGARRWISRIMLTWGVLAAAMMLVRTPWQFYSMRFLLGLAEAGFFPGVVYYLGQWFPPSERARAISRFYVAVPLSGVVTGVIAGGLLGLDGRLGLRGWQWLFLVEGLPAVLLGVAILVLLPDRPADARWLTPGEKAWMQAHADEELASHGGPGRRTVVSALFDPVVLQFAAVNALMLGAYYAFTLSGPVMLKAVTGLGATGVGDLVAGASLFGAACMVVTSWSSDRLRERHLHLAGSLLLVAAGYAAMSVTHSPPLFVAAYVLTIGASMAAAPILWPPVSESVHPAAVAVSLAAVNCVGQTGSFVATTLWGWAHDRTGGYGAGMTALPLCYLAAVAILLGLRAQHHARWRAKLALAAAG